MWTLLLLYVYNDALSWCNNLQSMLNFFLINIVLFDLLALITTECRQWVTFWWTSHLSYVISMQIGITAADIHSYSAFQCSCCEELLYHIGSAFWGALFFFVFFYSNKSLKVSSYCIIPPFSHLLTYVTYSCHKHWHILLPHKFSNVSKS